MKLQTKTLLHQDKSFKEHGIVAKFYLHLALEKYISKIAAFQDIDTLSQQNIDFTKKAPCLPKSITKPAADRVCNIK